MVTLLPKAEIARISKKKEGNTKASSVKRCRKASKARPKYPEEAPIAIPKTTDTVVDSTPIAMEMRPPYMMRLSWSRLRICILPAIFSQR